MPSKRDMELIYELGALRFIPRSWNRFVDTNFQNLAEHHLRVIWLALLIAKYEKATNTERIMKMALVHDIAESRTGDVDYLSRQYVERNEALGVEDMLDGTALDEEFTQLWHEFEKRECIESKIVKDADWLDVDFELQEQRYKGIRLDEVWAESRDVVREKLNTKTAKRIAVLMKEVHPHDWHNKGRNRLNAGDWKRPKK